MEKISDHIMDYFSSLYLREEWNRPKLDNLHFPSIGEDRAQWPERGFEEVEIRRAVFDLAGDIAPHNVLSKVLGVNEGGYS